MPNLNLDSLLHTRVYCDRGVIPAEPFVMHWNLFMYQGDNEKEATCTYDTDHYKVRVDNSHNGACLTGLEWRVDVSGG